MSPDFDRGENGGSRGCLAGDVADELRGCWPKAAHEMGEDRTLVGARCREIWWD
ncbi:hypothetical protein [uncultured Propionibacterium sp.]|uniref:hypothetical protein n=1 Tax=uncultured Propionibacterium sp. TaxID=218066 RepID=UPI00293127B2|nr:hypothetical protein [uncultured Propionibacterium sp.]